MVMVGGPRSSNADLAPRQSDSLGRWDLVESGLLERHNLGSSDFLPPLCPQARRSLSDRCHEAF